MRRVELKTILGFFMRLALLYIALMALWLVIGGVYATAFRWMGNGFAAIAGCSGFISIEPYLGAPGQDNALILVNHETGARGTQPINSRLLGYVPTALLIAMVLATPIPPRRRAMALGWGLLLVHLYIGMRIAAIGLSIATGDPPLALLEAAPVVRGVIVFLAGLLGDSMMGCFLGSIFIWIMVAFRSRDWSAAPADATT